MTGNPDPFGARATLQNHQPKVDYYRLDALAKRGGTNLERMPHTVKILLENVLRHCGGGLAREDDVLALAGWSGERAGAALGELPFLPARVVLQDFTGVPAVVDLAAMRSAVARRGGDPERINPLAPADLVIDHSVQVDFFGSRDAFQKNVAYEYQRNRERYLLLRWGQKAFRNFRVVPPGTGIVHQVNLEYLASVVESRKAGDTMVAFPDTLVGTDSHTTMVNGLGVLGWGVGGIEAEAVLLGQPLYQLAPVVVGLRLQGELPVGTTATDLVLTVTQLLRKHGVVGKFVEFAGSGLRHLTLADRATISNMAPEYGATAALFPVDDETLRYLRTTGRPAERVALVERYTKEQGLFRTDTAPEPTFSETLALDLATIEPSLAGPKRPQDRVGLARARASFREAFPKQFLAPDPPNAVEGKQRFDWEGGTANEAEAPSRPVTGVAPNARSVEVALDGTRTCIGPGSVVIAAITSCTNTSNPVVMVSAGLIAKKAVERGLETRPYVKTSLAPGSRVVTDYLKASGLLPYLEQLHFNVVGYGCTTCIAAGTPVLLANGTARRIEHLPDAGGAVLFSPTPDGELGVAIQAEVMNQGLRDCVSLVLQDGRELVCTPDHEVLRTDGCWVRADQLVPGQDRVVVGLEAPLDEPNADEARYSLSAGELVLSMDTPPDRLRTLAFARLLGHLLGDGSISTAHQGGMNVGQAVDREAVLDDIELVTGKRPAATRYDERKWAIVLPAPLTEAIIALPGVRVGRRIDQTPLLPAFVLDDACPVAVVREFLGGVFGADGRAPVLKRLSEREEDAILEPPAYAQSAKPEHVGQLKEVMGQIIHLLHRCGVKIGAAKVYEFPVRHVSSSYPPARDGDPRIEVRLELPDGLSFVERVGFRYSVDKQLRATAAAVYWRTIDGIHRQRLWMASPPSPVELLTQLGVRGWFAPLRTRAETDYSKRYCVEKLSATLPTLALEVLERRPAGERTVFDLAVEDLHAFVAGTVAVHNCIGNSGPLPEPVGAAIMENDLVVAAVLSGNRNFEGRIHPQVRASYLASPPLVVAYALAGTIDIDLTRDPLGTDRDGKPVYLRDLWPHPDEVRAVIEAAFKGDLFQRSYASVFTGDEAWRELPVPEGSEYTWDPTSTYIQEPPFFTDLPAVPPPLSAIAGARVLALLGDSVTTDHISPAGSIPKDSPAGRYLIAHGVEPRDFNSYGARRGNHQVMMRGTFGNIRLRNALVPSREGDWTVHVPSGEEMRIFEAAERYAAERTPLLVIAGQEYGSGSSRDWAAKGTLLLGVKAVIAESYERIHRSNLIGMGVLALQFKPGESAATLGLDGKETYDIRGLGDDLRSGATLTVEACGADGRTKTFQVIARVDSPIEIEYLRHGGILQMVLRNLTTT